MISTLPDSAVGSLEPFTGAKVPPAGARVNITGAGGVAAAEIEPEAEYEPDYGAGISSSPLLSTGYKVGPQDVLNIKAYPPNILPESTTVRPDGTIVLPVVGVIDVTNMTVYQIADRVQNLMKRDFKRPWVEVSVAEYNSITVRIYGQMSTTQWRQSGTGEYGLKENTRILEFVTNIGGFDKTADLKNISVFRKDGTEKKIDFTKIMSDPKDPDNIQLEGGDIIRVPAIEEAKIKVRVVALGQISKQGVINLDTEHSGLVEAISAGGGFSELAALDRVQVLRDQNGMQKTTVVDASSIIAGSAPDYLLEPGDLVYVPRRTEKKSSMDRLNDFLKEILPTANFMYLIDRL